VLYWSKIADFNLPHVFGTLTENNLARISPNLWQQKTRIRVQLYGVACLHDPRFSCLGRTRTCGRQMDGQTDTHTQWQHISC